MRRLTIYVIVAASACGEHNPTYWERPLDVYVACRVELDARRRCELEAGFMPSPMSVCDAIALAPVEDYYCKAEIYDQTDCGSASNIVAAAQRFIDRDCPETLAALGAP